MNAEQKNEMKTEIKGGVNGGIIIMEEEKQASDRKWGILLYM